MHRASMPRASREKQKAWFLFSPPRPKAARGGTHPWVLIARDASGIHATSIARKTKSVVFVFPATAQSGSRRDPSLGPDCTRCIGHPCHEHREKNKKRGFCFPRHGPKRLAAGPILGS